MPQTHADGTYTKAADGRYVLRFERRLDHPIERVWAALTDPAHLADWLADARLDLREGGEVELRWLNTDDEGNTAVLNGTITELDPPRVIEYDGSIHGLLRWELREHGDGCILTFTNATPATGDQLAKNLAGWHWHIDYLDRTLAGDTVDWPRWYEVHYPEWEVHHARYVAAGAG